MAVTVLQALSGGGVGGTERMVTELVARLSPQVRSEVSVLARTDGLRLASPVHVLDDAGRSLPAARRLARMVDERAIDVVHLYGYRMSLVGRLAMAWVRGRRPVLVHGIRGRHLTDWPEVESLRTRAAILLERAGSRWIDVYATNSDHAAAFLRARGLSGARFRIIPNGIDVEYWSPAAGHPREPLLACVANLRPVKRHELLVDAAQRLRSAGIPCRLVFAGEGSLRARLQDAVTRAGLGEVVSFAGSLDRDDVRALLRRASAAVLASAWEGMPVSLLEALACGCPVVAPAVPGIEGVVRHEDTGLLTASTGHALADACARVLQDAALRDRLAQRARADAVARFSLPAMVGAYEAFYLELGGERR